MRVAMIVAVAGCLCMATADAWAQASPDLWRGCADGRTPDASITACSTIIQAGQERPDHLAGAYLNPGLSHAANDEDAPAHPHHTQPLQLTPHPSAPLGP